jgi:hypothetical protein
VDHEFELFGAMMHAIVFKRMNNRRASPAASLTFKLYSDKETTQAASPHVFFDIPLVFALDS